MNEGTPRGGFRGARAMWAVAVLILVGAVAVFAVAYSYAATGTTSSAPSTSVDTSTTVASVAATTSLPPDAVKKMYYEQVDSNENSLVPLAEGQFTKITFGKPTGTGTSRIIPIVATYEDGNTLSGHLELTRYQGAWFFDSIARDGNSLGVSPREAIEDQVEMDWSVANTIVNQQASNQDIITGIANGDYDVMTLGTPEGGADTVTIPITLKGSGSTVTGHIIQIRKVLSGTTFWFITSFEK